MEGRVKEWEIGRKDRRERKYGRKEGRVMRERGDGLIGLTGRRWKG